MKQQISVVYLHWLRLDNVPHVGAWFRWLEWLEATIWSWDLDVWRHVRVRSWEGSGLDTIWWQRHLQLLSLDSLDAILFLSLLITNLLCPFGVSSISWWHAVLQSGDSFLINLLFLFLLLLELESLTLEHGELRNSCKHFSG